MPVLAATFRIFNTRTRQVEPVDPVTPGKLRFYSCGPTVYSYAHIGNFRSFLSADLIYRTARAAGLDVSYVTNVTDVGHLTLDDLSDPAGEDRMVKALNSKEGEQFANIWDLARYYTKVLIEDWKSLNLLEPTVRPRATDHIREQISAVQQLLESGHAYETDKGIYFDVSKFAAYGELSGNTDAVELAPTERNIVTDDQKRDSRDFALWKKDSAHLMQWYSPWGWGFPGWHIECSVMSMSYLGEEIDIHAGGEDLIFPHHECEIAQSESLTGKTFARHWVHTRFLQVEGQKMSKRAGNFYTVRDLISPQEEGGRGIDPLAVRMTLMSGHYRKPFNFTFETLKANIRHRQRFEEAMAQVQLAQKQALAGPDELGKPLARLRERAFGAMLDDLNTPEALAAAIEGVKLILSVGKTINASSSASASDWLKTINRLLGIVSAEYEEIKRSEASDFGKKVELLIEERKQARSSRDFTRADAIRDSLSAMGIALMDTPEGVVWKRLSNLD